MGVDKPNYTQIPNLMLDDLLMLMGEAEMKVTLAIARRTFGYHREMVELSLNDLHEITHLSRQGVINGINAGLERGTIYRKDGKRGGFIYGLCINGEHDATSQQSRLVNEVDQPSTSQPNGLALVNEVDQTSQRSRPPLVNEVDLATPTLKKVLKKEKKESIKESVVAPATPTPQQEMFGAICEAIGWDYNTLSKDDQGQVAQLGGVLSKANYTVADIRRFITDFWFKDWRWLKEGKPPTLKQLRQEIGIIRSALNGVGPSAAKKEKGINGFREMLANQGIEL